jgi:hypothetical protein
VKAYVVIRITRIVIIFFKPPTDGYVNFVSSGITVLSNKHTVDIVSSELEIPGVCRITARGIDAITGAG